MPTGWTIHCDRLITRRKRYHSVVNPQGLVEFKSRLLGECIEYLAAQDVLEYQLAVEPFGSRRLHTLDVKLERQPQWQN